MVAEPQDRIKAAFDGDELARAFAERGDVQAACFAAGVRRRGMAGAEIFSVDPARRGWWLRLEMKRGAALFREGRILVGPPGAGPAACRQINADSRNLLVDKPATKMVLEIMGIPTPAGRKFEAGRMQEALDYARSRGGPVCVKATQGSLGIRVYPNLSDPDNIRAALAAVEIGERSVLVEDHVAGQAARFIFVRPNVVGARRDLPANVIGDGRSSVAQLLAAKNAAKLRWTGQAAVRTGKLELRILAEQGLKPDSIPEAERRVFLRNLSNLSQGGDCATWSGPICASYAAEIARLCNAIPGVFLAAVDTIIVDPTRPAAPGNWSVIELNSAPGVIGFHFPWEGEPQDMVGAILDWLETGEAWNHA